MKIMVSMKSILFNESSMKMTQFFESFFVVIFARFLFKKQYQNTHSDGIIN